jgi:hypothetical protein
MPAITAWSSATCPSRSRDVEARLTRSGQAYLTSNQDDPEQKRMSLGGLGYAGGQEV